MRRMTAVIFAALIGASGDPHVDRRTLITVFPSVSEADIMLVEYPN